MYSIFEDRTRRNNSIIRFPEFDYYKRNYQRELLKVEDYYHTRVYSVKNNHLLSRLITQISIPFQYGVERYVEVAETRAPYIASYFKMTTELSKGILHDGVFFGKGTKEIILHETEYFNPYEAERNWKNLQAVKVLLHPKSNLDLLLPNGRNSSSANGLAAVSVNIAMLAFQFRCFLLSQKAKFENNDGLLGVTHFLHMYVLPNMLATQLDISILNRMTNIFYGAPMEETYVKHPFHIYDYEHQVDKVLDKTIKNVQGRKMRYDALLQQIPAIYSEDMQEALIMPDITPTRQVHWALILSRLYVMEFLIDLGGERSLGDNRVHINQLKRTIRRLQSDHVFEAELDKDMLYDVHLVLDKMLAL